MDIVALLKAMGDETRIRLLNLLHGREHTVGELTRILAMGQSRISRHLKILADSGLVQSRRDGLWVFYTCAGGGEAAALLRVMTPYLQTDPHLRDDQRQAALQREREQRKMTRRFDSLASRWDTLKREVLGGLDLNARITEHLPACAGVADLGCGTGELLPALASLPEVRRVIGVDSSMSMLAHAAERVGAPPPFDRPAGQPVHGLEELDEPGKPGSALPVELRLGRIEHLPMRDGEVDCAVLNLVLHHLSQPAEALLEVSRVIRPGGVLVVVDFLPHRRERMRHEFADRWLGFSPAQLRQWLARAGFRTGRTSRTPVNMDLQIAIYVATREKQDTGGMNE